MGEENERIKRSRVILRPSYSETLKAIPVGETQCFRATVHTYGGMHTASCRLNAQGKGVWTVELVKDEVKVTRIA